MAAQDEDYVDRGDFFEDSSEDDEELEEQEEEEIDEDTEEEEGTEEEEESEYEEEEEEAPPKKEPRIPKSRFDDVNKRMKDATERNLWLEEQLEKLINQASQQKQQAPDAPPAPTYDYDAAEESYISLIIEGEIAKASRLRNEINAYRQKDLQLLIKGIEDKTAEKAQSQSSLLMEKERFESSINNMESKYPFLNHKDKAYNEEAVETVNTLLAGYIAAGKGKVESLQLAIKKVLPLYEKRGTTKTVGEQRKIEAGKKASQAARQQPAKTKTSGTKTSDMGKVDINRISERDFAKLTAKEKSILRGD
jgi:hypothetical protein